MFLYYCMRFYIVNKLPSFKMNRFVALLLFVIALGNLNAQTSRAYIKAAEQFIVNGYFEEAIDQYTKAIELEPRDGKAYAERAKAFLQINKFEAAAQDYKSAAVFGENASENYFLSAQLFYQLGNTTETEESLQKAISLKPKYGEAFLLLATLYLEEDLPDKALEAATSAIDSRSSAYAYYLKGLAEFELQNYPQAEQDLEKAIIKDRLLLDAYLALAKIKLINNQSQYAIDNCNYVILNDRNNTQAYLIRSKAYNSIREFEKAIADVSKAITIDTSNVAYYISRGKLYFEYAQFQNAINDFTIGLSYDMVNIEALELRAAAYEKTEQNLKAISDLSLLISLSDNDESENVMDYEERIFELSRESDKPTLTLITPELNNDFEVTVPVDAETVTITTKINDASKLKMLKINSDTVFFSPNGTHKQEFTESMPAANLEFLTLSAVDIYDNTTSLSYSVKKVETHAPKITLLNPYVGDDDIISISSDEKYLYLEGRVEDESHIASIHIDEFTASYTPRDMNPRFTATVDITQKTKILLIAIDENGNRVEKEYLFRKDGRMLTSDSPMGKTWVVLIENSEYKDFPNLNSPSKDMQLMQQALSRYKINKIIVKRNLTKRELERFFSIDLRDLVRSNNVNSLFIWYAGHGENVKGNGYWIPSDATTDVEFSYFNVNALKASLYSYSSLTHILVVSDACKTGPGFCLAMRGPIEGVACSQTQLALQKSAQVFTSAGSGYAYDNSLFTRAFANALFNNEDDCATIDDIAKRVNIIMQNSSLQKPEFGRISGIEDELGTFFFITQ